MNISRKSKLVLLIGSENDNLKQLTDLLMSNGFKVERANHLSAAFQKTIELIPCIIICAYKLEDSDGFQVYNLFENTIVKKGIPFIVLLEHHNSEQIELGLELGVDNFIFLPLMESRIITKINVLLKKVEEHKAFDNERFCTMFADSPIGMIMLCDDKVEMVNNAFYRIVGVESIDLEKTHPREFFNSEGRDKDQAEFNKCLIGLIKNCKIKDVPLVRRNIKVDLHVSHFCNLTTNRILVQIIESKSNIKTLRANGAGWISKNTNGNASWIEVQVTSQLKNIAKGFLTTREIEVTELSAKGYPIKEIADRLNISKRTVEKHRSNVMRKTGTTNIIEAISKVAELQ